MTNFVVLGTSELQVETTGNLNDLGSDHPPGSFHDLKWKQDWNSLQSLPAFTYQFVHKLRLKIAIAGKDWTKLPAKVWSVKRHNGKKSPTDYCSVQILSILLACSSAREDSCHQLDGVFGYTKHSPMVSVGSVLKWRARPQCLRSKACLCLADEQHIYFLLF
jgi:hypothetical protein